ncbi:undecaprenyl-diphosphatase [Gillisia sp. Hel1_33_143]|uniref:phosphatase PAP2 family protein n=1 Tax=unclassified Gillisia TaxID=2615025 RepID=UPI00054ECC24|nr:MULTISPECIES: phosphatase PAP2 family protein [unclassified Gillisia]SDR66913.1 undecaprenyl-diphosphatase [Gillisia sp. Hel1_33_143]
MLERLNEWDGKLFVFLNNLGVEQYDNFWIFVTNIKHWIPLYIFFFVLYFITFHWKKALLSSTFLLLTFYVTFVFTNLIKNYSSRLRPNNNPDLSDIIRILQTPDNYSFFSGHASVSFAVTTFFVLSLKSSYKWIYLFYLWPFIFVTSRIYVGVHYPSDIIVGTMIGIIFGFLGFKIFKKISRK